MTEPTYNDEQRAVMVDIALRSIQHGLDSYGPEPVDALLYSSALQQHRGTFVTLERYGQLRGCIGTLDAYQPLIVDVAVQAHAAAFHDPRSPPLSNSEFRGLEQHIAVFSPPEPPSFRSEADLLGQLRPGVDGLILMCGEQRATFLPAVWESLPEPDQFLIHLKQKAGFDSSFWSKDVRAERYTTESFDNSMIR